MTKERISVYAFEIRDVAGLDPVRVVLQDVAPGQGRIIIECYGEAWSAYWGAMGDQCVAAFIAKADSDYLMRRLWPAKVSIRSEKALEKAEAYLLRIVEAVKAALAAGEVAS